VRGGCSNRKGSCSNEGGAAVTRGAAVTGGGRQLREGGLQQREGGLQRNEKGCSKGGEPNIMSHDVQQLSFMFASIDWLVALKKSWLSDHLEFGKCILAIAHPWGSSAPTEQIGSNDGQGPGCR
jgi:hypothetical protein